MAIKSVKHIKIRWLKNKVSKTYKTFNIDKLLIVNLAIKGLFS